MKIRKADKERFDRLQQIGCIACLLDGRYLWADVHHILSGGYREDHQHTIPLCPWHHRSVPQAGMSQRETYELMGPSLDRKKREFVERYGTELFLKSLVDYAIDVYRKAPYNGMPQSVRNKLREMRDEQQ